MPRTHGRFNTSFQRYSPTASIALVKQAILDFGEIHGPSWIARQLGYENERGEIRSIFWEHWRKARGSVYATSNQAEADRPKEIPDPVDPATIGPDDWRWPLIQDTPEGFRAFNDHFWGGGKRPEPMPRHSFAIAQSAFDYDCCEAHRWVSILFDREPAVALLLTLNDQWTGLCGNPHGTWKANVILNVFPGGAKSIYFVRRWTIWRMCSKGRRWRIMILSETNRLAADWVNEIAEILEGTSEVGVAICQAFGQFKDDKANSWRPGHSLLKFKGAPITVRWNVIGVGWNQQYQGMRLDEVVIDDPETPEFTITIEDRERGIKKLDYVIENRLEPEGGGVRLIATRIELKDIPGLLAEKTWDDGSPVWQVISFPALIDPDTGKASLADNAVSLWSARFSVKVLHQRRQKLRELFESSFQQNPRPLALATFDMRSIYGPENSDVDRKGCLDRDRPLGKPADEDHWRGEKIRVFSLDPSGGAGWWAMVVADVNTPRDSPEFRCVILDIRRGIWTTQRFLDEVSDICNSYHPQFFIPESNMRADLWNGENRDFTRLKLRHQFEVTPHRTGPQNRRDLDWGVKSLALDFFDGRIRIPYGDEEARRNASKWLLTELYEHPNGRTDDVLMALWFLKVGWRGLHKPPDEPEEVNGGWNDLIPDWSRW